MEITRKNKGQTSETEESGTAGRREKKRSFLFAFLLILTLLSTMAYCTFNQFKIEKDDAYASLRNSMYSLRSLINFEGALQDSFTSMRDSETVMYVELAKPYFDYLGVSAETLNDCKENWEADHLYFFPDEGEVITTDNPDPFTLSDSQFRTLKTEGMILETSGSTMRSGCRMDG